MRTISLKDVKPGDIFKRKPDAQTVFIRDHYSPYGGTCTDFYDIGRCIFLRGKTQVFVDFDF
jgi:hypothetical protein